jgi:hypothetical protein
MPTNEVDQTLYDTIVNLTPAALHPELRVLMRQLDSIVTAGFLPDSSVLQQTDLDDEDTAESASIGVDPEDVKKFRPLIKYLTEVNKKYRRENRKKKHIEGGGGDGDDGDVDDDDYEDIPEDQDGTDPEDDGSQPELFKQLKEQREKRKRKRIAHQQFRHMSVLLDYVLEHVSRQGALLRQAHLLARNQARTVNQMMAQLDKGQEINVSPLFLLLAFISY